MAKIKTNMQPSLAFFQTNTHHILAFIHTNNKPPRKKVPRSYRPALFLRLASESCPRRSAAEPPPIRPLSIRPFPSFALGTPSPSPVLSVLLVLLVLSTRYPYRSPSLFPLPFAAKIPLPPKILNRPRQPLLQRDLRLPA